MSNKTQLQTNNSNLDALITRVNAAKDTAASLPEAGGGGSVETCTVTITNNLASKISWTNFAFGINVVNSDGTIGMTTFYASLSGSPTYTNVLANSVIFVTHNDVSYEIPEVKITLTNVTQLQSLYAYKMPGAGESGTIVIS